MYVHMYVHVFGCMCTYGACWWLRTALRIHSAADYKRMHAHLTHAVRAFYVWVQDVASLLVDVAALAHGTEQGAVTELQQTLGKNNPKVTHTHASMGSALVHTHGTGIAAGTCTCARTRAWTVHIHTHAHSHSCMHAPSHLLSMLLLAQHPSTLHAPSAER